MKPAVIGRRHVMANIVRRSEEAQSTQERFHHHSRRRHQARSRLSEIHLRLALLFSFLVVFVCSLVYLYLPDGHRNRRGAAPLTYHPDSLYTDWHHTSFSHHGHGFGAFDSLHDDDLDTWHTGHLPFLDTSTLTAVLPVTEESLQDLGSTLDHLMDEGSFVTNVVLVTASALMERVRSVAGVLLHDKYHRILPLLDGGFDTGYPLFRALANISTEYTLFLDPSGFDKVGTEFHDILLYPWSITVPLGVCGIRLEGNNVTCVSPAETMQDASYLLPPFVVRTVQARSLGVELSMGGNIWASLGHAVAGYLPGGVGGLVLSSHETNGSQCVHICDNSLGILEEPLNPAEELSNSSSTNSFSDVDSSISLSQVPPVSQLDHSKELKHTAPPPSFVVIAHDLGDIEYLANAICRLIDNGNNVFVLVLSLDQRISPDGAPRIPWVRTHMAANRCDFPFYRSSLEPATSPFYVDHLISTWLKGLPASRLILLCGPAENPVLTYHAILELRRLLGDVVVELSSEDIKYSDWLGSVSPMEWARWHEPQIDISIVTNDRPESLQRLLRSLRASLFYGDQITLRINLEQTADEETIEMVHALQWDHGNVYIHHRVIQGGLLPAIAESWYPQSNDSYVIILEDDIELSPLFYAWAKMGVLRYRYGDPADRSPNVFGISLYQQKSLELLPEGRRRFSARALFDDRGYLYPTTPYLSQIPCSWGAVYFPEHWKEFHSYLNVRFSELVLPMEENVVPDVRSNRWTQSWKKFFIELAYIRGYSMLYPNYANFSSLSTNHLEVGSHVKDLPRDVYNQKKSLFTLPLIALPDSSADKGQSGLLFLPRATLPPFHELPVLDLLGVITTGEALIQVGVDRVHELGCTHLYRNFRIQDMIYCRAGSADASLL